MANLAIKGHATRGKEVIEILEMLGGKNKISPGGTKKFNGTNVGLYYTIEEGNYIHVRLDSRKGDYIKFTLEKFLKKFPYKVGDKVIIKCKNQEAIVNEVVWCCDTIAYWLKHDGIIEGNWRAEHLQPYKKETMEEININRISFNGDKAKLILPDGYEIQTEDKEVYVVKKKPQYLKTYEECCDILGIDVSRDIEHTEHLPFYRDINQYDVDLLGCLRHFRKLLICRDAYWKIAGEQMGWSKPWKPDWTNHEFKHCIKVMGNTLECISEMNIQCILAFPTPEMRDAFKENFDPDIEICKELL